MMNLLRTIAPWLRAISALLIAGLVISQSADAQTWTTVYPAYPMHDYASVVHWNGDTALVAGNNGGLLQTTDAGRSWKSVFSQAPRMDFIRMGRGRDAVYLLPAPSFFTRQQFSDTTAMFLYRFVPGRSDTERVVVPVHAPTHMRRSLSTDLSVTQDGIMVLQLTDSLVLMSRSMAGGNWQSRALPDSLLSVTYGYPAICFRSQQLGLLSNGKQLFRTNDGGSTWNIVPEFTLRLDPMYTFLPYPMQWTSDSVCIVLDAESRLRISSDAGMTWRVMSSPSCDIEAFVFDASGAGFTFGRTLGICRTTDHGASWVRSFDGYQLNNLYARAAMLNGSGCIVAGYNGYILETADQGLSWGTPHVPEYGAFKNVHFFDTNNGLVMATDLQQGDQWLLRTLDGGETWQRVLRHRVIAHAAILYADAKTWWAVRSPTNDCDTVVYRSTDAGSTWVSMLHGIARDSLRLVAQQPGSQPMHGRDSLMLLLQDDRFLCTTDGGASWNIQDAHLSLLQPVDRQLKLSHAMQHEIQWLRLQGSMHRSTDLGRTWTQCYPQTTLPANAAIVSMNAITTDHVVAVLETGGVQSILETKDGGTTWGEHVLAFERPDNTVGPPSIKPHIMFPGGWGFSTASIFRLKHQQESALLRTKDSWRSAHVQSVRHLAPGAVMLYGDFFLDEQHGWYATLSSVARTLDGGVNEVNVPRPEADHPKIEQMHPHPVPSGMMMQVDIVTSRNSHMWLQIDVHDLIGRRCISRMYMSVGQSRARLPLPTAGLQPGVYLLRVASGGGTSVRSFLVK